MLGDGAIQTRLSSATLFDRQTDYCYIYVCIERGRIIPLNYDSGGFSVGWNSYRERSQMYGVAIRGACAVAASGVPGRRASRKSYWALALPVIVGFGGALYVAFWIGRALITTPLEPPSQGIGLRRASLNTSLLGQPGPATPGGQAVALRPIAVGA